MLFLVAEKCQTSACKAANDNRIGRVYWSNAFDAAIADYTEAIRLDPNESVVYYFRAGNYLRIHQYDKAIADFTEAVRIEPENVGFWIRRVSLPLAAGLPDDYRKDLSGMVYRFGKSDELSTEYRVPWLCAVRPDSGADCLLSQIHALGINKLVFDLERADYFGSQMIELLIIAWRYVSPAHGTLALCHVSAAGREVLRVVGLDKFWPLCDTLDEALASPQKRWELCT